MSDDKLLISQLEDLLDSGRLPTLEPGGEVTLSKEDLPEEQCPDSPAIEFENANNRISELESENAELRKVLAECAATGAALSKRLKKYESDDGWVVTETPKAQRKGVSDAQSDSACHKPPC